MPEQVTLAVIASIVSIVSLLFSIYMGLRGNKRTDTKDIEERVKNNTEINMKLDVISSTTAEIKNEVSSMKEDIRKLDRRIVIVEESAKSAHHRLDGLENRLSGEREE